ncbi:hypothetical protein H6F67_14720 [Microcoleus sp. FACHB-1515]|uniref:hypothetical protein n=1 Tax=Cyanophyceae TaxID=3028117 RepID=UPI0016857156|nr:hypothetical protein [Microcoleus sp. FACHB-1515]MBD2091105.1 hypothetical protein [Microcoleus sp. FACHB-1515]
MGLVYRFATLLIFPLLIGSTVWTAPSAASQPSTVSDANRTANQPYQPPDNGGPDGTIGSGTR